MAKKKAGDAVEGEEGEKKKKKPIVPIVVVVIGLFGAKTFLMKDAVQTPAQLKAAEAAKALVLYNKCAEANNLPTATDVATGTKLPSELPTLPQHSGSPTTKGAAGRRGATPRGAIAIQLVSTDGADGTLVAAAAAGGAPLVEGMGPVLSLDSVTVNLTDGHYLKLGLALQLDVTGDATAAKEQGLGAKAIDMALGELEKHSQNELIAPAKRESIKQALGVQVCQAYKGAVLSVYFTEFVMQ